MIETRHIRHLLAVARHRNFGRAAEEIGITQPALTRSIQALEQRLGVRLFDRGRAGVDPTSMGKIAIRSAERIAASLLDFETEVEELTRGQLGSLRLALGTYPSVLSGHTAIARLLSEHADLRCSIRVGRFTEVRRLVASGTSDLGVVELSGVENDAELVAQPIVSRPIGFVCRPDHPLVERAPLKLDDLLDFPWASQRAPERMRMFLPADPRRAGSWSSDTGQFVPAVETDLMLGVYRLVSESDIVAVTSPTVVRRELELGALRILPFHEPWLRLNYGFLSRRNQTLPTAAASFRNIVLSIEEEIEVQELALRQQLGWPPD